MNSPKDEIADKILWKRYRPTFAEVHLYGWTDAAACEEYIMVRYRREASRVAITRRKNKLWDASRLALRVSANEYVEECLWLVTWDYRGALEGGIIPKLSSKRQWTREIFESPTSMGRLGWVSAPDINGARMAAMVTLGPRAHSEYVKFERCGFGGWEKAHELNKSYAAELQKDCQNIESSLKQKLWERENLECQIAFLQSSASFEAKSFREPEASDS